MVYNLVLEQRVNKSYLSHYYWENISAKIDSITGLR